MPTGLDHSKYFTPEEIETAFNAYLRMCDNFMQEEVSAGKVVTINKPLIPTLSGFRMFLGLSESGWKVYASDNPSYASYLTTIKRIEEFTKDAKINALTNGKGSTTGLIFDLKVNYGWKEQQHIDQTITYKADFGTDTIHTSPEAT